jgi:hypothetical protein
LGKQNSLLNPVYTGTEAIKKQIDPGFELIGMELTVDSTGSWINFILWPEKQPIY